jgi:hypothetical protein
MAKKTILQSDFDEDDAILSRKAKRRLVREAEKAANSSQGQPKASKPEEVVEDKMSQVARLCQNGQWREAAHLCLTTMASEEDAGIAMAFKKIDKSLRRQMAASFIVASQEMLKREYLLDVGK